MRSRAPRDRCVAALREHFRPEFLNRVDEIIVFRPLDEAQLREIVGLLLAGVGRGWPSRHDPRADRGGAGTLLAREGYDPVYGARPLQRAIQRRLENPLARRLLAGEFTEATRSSSTSHPTAS